MPTEHIDESTKQALKTLQEQVISDGIGGRFAELPVICPKCRKPMAGITVTMEHWTCDRCNYTQSGIKIGAGGKVAIGALIGAGVVALAWWLSQQKK